jgi:hypothetical protein
VEKVLHTIVRRFAWFLVKFLPLNYPEKHAVGYDREEGSPFAVSGPNRHEKLLSLKTVVLPGTPETPDHISHTSLQISSLKCKPPASCYCVHFVASREMNCLSLPLKPGARTCKSYRCIQHIFSNG